MNTYIYMKVKSFDAMVHFSINYIVKIKPILSYFYN